MKKLLAIVLALTLGMAASALTLDVAENSNETATVAELAEESNAGRLQPLDRHNRSLHL